MMVEKMTIYNSSKEDEIFRNKQQEMFKPVLEKA